MAKSKRTLRQRIHSRTEDPKKYSIIRAQDSGRWMIFHGGRQRPIYKADEQAQCIAWLNQRVKMRSSNG